MVCYFLYFPEHFRKIDNYFPELSQDIVVAYFTEVNSSVLQVRYGDQVRMSQKMYYLFKFELLHSMHDQSLCMQEGEKLYITLYHLDKNTNIFKIA